MKKLVLVLVLVALSCVGPKNTVAADSGLACDRSCEDIMAVRALRETIRIVYNLALQANPVGKFDATVPCIKGGRARVFGDATADATLGSSEVKLTYVLEGCGYTRVDKDPVLNYDTTASGTVEESGTLAVQPTATTALAFKSEGVTLTGRVFSPPVERDDPTCKLDITQKGNEFAGSICGRSLATFPYSPTSSGSGGFGNGGQDAIHAATTCDEKCADAIALRAVRETVKLAYNKTVQDKIAGHFDVTVTRKAGDAPKQEDICKIGTVKVLGDTKSNATQGGTEVKLTYVFTTCRYSPQLDRDPTQNYDVFISGQIEEIGTIMAPPGSTTALIFKSEGVAVTGTVFLPPQAYAASSCKLDVVQSGNNLGGTFCGRTTGVRL